MVTIQNILKMSAVVKAADLSFYAFKLTGVSTRNRSTQRLR
jgi:hypothetical protein